MAIVSREVDYLLERFVFCESSETHSYGDRPSSGGVNKFARWNTLEFVDNFVELPHLGENLSLH